MAILLLRMLWQLSLIFVFQCCIVENQLFYLSVVNLAFVNIATAHLNICVAMLHCWKLTVSYINRDNLAFENVATADIYISVAMFYCWKSIVLYINNGYFSVVNAVTAEFNICVAMLKIKLQISTGISWLIYIVHISNCCWNRWVIYCEGW